MKLRNVTEKPKANGMVMMNDTYPMMGMAPATPQTMMYTRVQSTGCDQRPCNSAFAAARIALFSGMAEGFTEVMFSSIMIIFKG